MNKVFKNFLVSLLCLAQVELKADRQIDVANCLGQLIHLAHEDFGLGHNYPLLLEARFKRQRDFLSDVLLPVVGKRAILESPATVRPIDVTENHLHLSGFGEGNNLLVSWVDRGGVPEIYRKKDGTLVLEVPKHYDFAQLGPYKSHLIKQWLIGHTLHPNIKSERGEREAKELDIPDFYHKEVQLQGIEAIREALRAKDPSFLYVGPTGVGKTEVLAAMLEMQVNASKQKKHPKLHVITAHLDGIVTQLEKDVRALYPENRQDVIVLTKQNFENMTLQEVIDLANKGRPVILVTTAQAFQRAVDADRTANVTKLRKVLSTFVLDEAHHLGAPELGEIVNQLMDRDKGSKAFLYGTTATPTHDQIPLIEQVFGKRAFFAYLDTPAEYKKNKDQGLERELKDILNQLYEATQRGELQPFKISPINPDKLNFEGLHIPDPKAPTPTHRRWVLNPQAFEDVTRALMPKLKEHKRGFFSVATVGEANAYKEFLQNYLAQNFRPALNRPVIEVLHSDLKPEEKKRIREDFEKGRINFLITVNMMNEGVNVPDLTLYVDLHVYVHPKQLLQRIGRILRLYEGKREPVEVITINRIEEDELAEALNGLDKISRGEKPNGDGPGPTEPLFRDHRNHQQDPEFAKRIYMPEEIFERAKRNREFFEQRKKEEIDVAKKAYEDIFAYATDHELDPFGRYDSDRGVGSLYKKLNKVFEMMGGASRGFRHILANPPPNLSTAVNRILAYQKAREVRRKQLETPAGMVDFLIAFQAKYQRVPGMRNGDYLERLNVEEQAVVDKWREYKPVPVTQINDYQIELLARNIKPEQTAPLGLHPQALEKIIKEDGKKNVSVLDRRSLVQLLDRFYVIHSRPPNERGTPLERLLFRALERVEGLVNEVNADLGLAHLEATTKPERVADKAQPTARVQAVSMDPLTESYVNVSTPAFLNRLENSVRLEVAAAGKSGTQRRNTLLQMHKAIEEYKRALDVWNAQTPDTSIEVRNQALADVERTRKQVTAPENVAVYLGMMDKVQTARISIKSGDKFPKTNGMVHLIDFLKAYAQQNKMTVREVNNDKTVELFITGDLAFLKLRMLSGVKVSVTPKESNRMTNHVSIQVGLTDAKGNALVEPAEIRPQKGSEDIKFNFYGKGTVRDNRLGTLPLENPEQAQRYFDELILYQMQARAK